MGITVEQQNILLRPLNGSRVATRSQAGRSLSYLEAWDVKAHLTRIFGFCNWDGEVIDSELAFETPPTQSSKNFNVGYRVVYRLTIRDQHGAHLCTHTEAAVGSASLPQRGEAHDMAIKTAESDALKRAAINLGTQFGLSLYNNGSTHDIIKATLVGPHVDGAEHALREDAPTEPVKAPVSDEQPEQVSEQGSVPASVLDMFSDAARIDDNAERILCIVTLKGKHSQHLDHIVQIGDQQMTVARYADLIAAGAFTEGAVQ